MRNPISHRCARKFVARPELAADAKARRTRTTIAPLKGDARVGEIADMIAGGADQKTARAEARRLLKEAATA